MQSSNVQASAASLLTQLIGSDLGAGDTLDGAGDQGFIGAMSGQIKELLIDAGEDPAKLAGIEDGALIAQFLALMQAQVPSAELMGGFGSGTSAALLQTGGEPKAGQSVAFGSLPSFVLEQLTQCAELDSEMIGRAGEPLDAVALVRQLLAARGQASDGAKPDSGLMSADLDADASTDLESYIRSLLTKSAEPGALNRDGGRVSADLGADASTNLESYIRSLLTKSAEPGLLDRVVAGQLPGASNTVQAGVGESVQAGSTAFPTGESLRDLMARGIGGIGEADGADTLDSAIDSSLSGTALHKPAGTDAQSVAQRTALLDLTRLLQPGGERRLAEQVRWFAQAGMETAEMRLHPPSLGTLDVRISMEADQAHVRFVTSHPIVKEVLEAALPRLREALAQEGLSLGDVTVSERAPEGRDETERDQAASDWTREDLDADIEEATEEPGLATGTLSALSRRLDYFA